MKMKVDPLAKDLEEKKLMIDDLVTKNKTLEENINKLDVHFTKIIKAILQNQGVAVKNLEAYDIMKQY